MTAQELAECLGDWRKVGARYLVHCPAHADQHQSLELKDGDKGVVMVCRVGCAQERVLPLVCAQAGITCDVLFYEPRREQAQPRIVATYDYCDAQGTLLFQAVRFDPKGFRQRRPNGHGGWLWNLDDIEPMLYRLPEILDAIRTGRVLYLVEGEKDVETLRALGFVATCNPMGAGKWRAAYNEPLRGADVVILPDHDAPGRQHAQQVAQALHGIAARIKMVELPNVPEKGDVSDWVAAGGTRDQLEALVAACPLWTPPDHGLPPSPPWPQMAPEAFYGLAGAIVEAIDPYTEADPVAGLMNILVGTGNAIGATPHARVQHDVHPARLNVVEVGESSKGRKGTGWSTPRYLLSQVDPTWAASRIKSGLSSGEGLIYNVRDTLWKHEPIKDKGRVVDYQEVEADLGEADKRLLIVEPEFAAALTAMAREGNILSAVIRQAWDDGHLSPLTRNNPMKATGAHISIIGHITKQELLARLDDTSKGNGFANRFLWVLVKRSKYLPQGAAAPEAVLRPLVDRLITVFTFARTVSELKRDDEANTLWDAVYAPLSDGKPGLLGAIISRAEAQVLRLSVLYAVLDQSTTIKAAHLKAALAVWEYCEQSARMIFGERLGDPTADRILDALRTAGPTGMTENDIYELFGRNKSANDRARALTMLAALGRARADKEDTGGRPRTIWRAT
jgi:hypothetical protein